MIDDGIVNLISNVGFPIAAFLLMYFQSNKIIQKNTEALNRLSDVVNRCPHNGQ